VDDARVTANRAVLYVLLMLAAAFVDIDGRGVSTERAS
jgi:hypothetical protein